MKNMLGIIKIYKNYNLITWREQHIIVDLKIFKYSIFHDIKINISSTQKINFYYVVSIKY